MRKTRHSLVKAGKKNNIGRKLQNASHAAAQAALLAARIYTGQQTSLGRDDLYDAQFGRIANNNHQQARGRGAYGRGAYGRSTAKESQANVNSLFLDYKNRRHKTREIGDETGRVRVSRREYVMRVVAPEVTTEFQNTSFAINPGLSGVFAWLSQIAANYDEYTLEHLVFHYKPVISQASTSGAMGSILLSANYNAGSGKFASFREMAEYMGTLETRVCDEALFGVECDPRKNGSQEVEYVRTGSVPMGQDIKTYDLATFQLATSDVGSFAEGTLLGHLYVEYDVVLGKPKLFSALGKAILVDMYRGLTPITVTSPMAGAISHPSNNLGAELAGKIITLPTNFYGRIILTYVGVATSLTLGATNISILADSDIVAVPILGLPGIYAEEIVNSGSKLMIQKIYDVSTSTHASGNRLQINFDSITSGTGFTLSIAQCNPDFGAW